MKGAFWFGLGLAVGIVGVIAWDRWQNGDGFQGDEQELSESIDQHLLSLETRADIAAQAARN